MFDEKRFIEESHVVDFLTPEKFMTIIIRMMREHNINIIEAVVMYCDKNDIDVEEVQPFIKRQMKEMIKHEAQVSGMMKRESTLPI